MNKKPRFPALMLAAILIMGLWPAETRADYTASYLINSGSVYITTAGDYYISGNGNYTDYSISVADNVDGPVNITIENVRISTPFASPLTVGNRSHVNLTLFGTNNLISTTNQAGIKVLGRRTDAELEVATLVITAASTGSLEAVGCGGGAGIGGSNEDDGDGKGRRSCGSVYIYGGTIKANGVAGSANGIGGAGIGGGGNTTAAYGGDGGRIFIAGGTVGASSSYGAGIGAGMGKLSGDGGFVHITGGTVTATSQYGAGIGTANGYPDSIVPNELLPEAATIFIEGGTVTAMGGDGSAGIGGSFNVPYGTGGGFVLITGGNVTAHGGKSGGAGIGGGQGYGAKAGDGGVVDIRGGVVTATGGDGDSSERGGAGIGGGGDRQNIGGLPGALTISGGIVRATGGGGAGTASGIGRGGGAQMGSSGTLVMTGGTVIATGANNGKGVDGYRQIRMDGGSLYSANGGMPAVYSTQQETLYPVTVTLPGMDSVTPVTYTVDGGDPIPSVADETGKLYLWLPEAAAISVGIAAGPAYYTATGPVETSGSTFTAVPGENPDPGSDLIPRISLTNGSPFTVTVDNAQGRFAGVFDTAYGTLTGTADGNDTVLTGTLTGVPGAWTEITLGGHKLKIRSTAPPSTTVENPAFY